MKTLIRHILALAALVTLAVAANATTLVLNVNVFNGASDYDEVNQLGVPAGSYCNYYEYVITSGAAEVRVSGPGIDIDDRIVSGSSSGGGGFTSGGSVTGSVYAGAGFNGQAVAHLEIVW